MKRHCLLFLCSAMIMALAVLASGCGQDDSSQTGQTGASLDHAARQADHASDQQSGPVTAPVGGSPGMMAPEFDLAKLDGSRVKLSELRGDVVIVDFWATWCPPCRKALPHLQQLHQEYGDKGVTIIGIAMDVQGAKIVEPYVARQKLDFAVVLPDGKVDRGFGGIQHLPTTFVIGPDGKVYQKLIGYQDKSTYLKAILALKPELAS